MEAEFLGDKWPVRCKSTRLWTCISDILEETCFL